MAAVPIGLSRNGEIRLLFEDDRYLAVLKPAGLLVHKTPIDAHENENLRDILRGHYSGRLDPVHRLPTRSSLIQAGPSGSKSFAHPTGGKKLP